MFSSRTAESFDPKPWVNPYGDRVVHGDPRYERLDPRPHFEPTRDPKPWVFDTGMLYGRSAEFRSDKPCWWAPFASLARPEPNPILVAFRSNAPYDGSVRDAAEFWLSDVIDTYGYSPDHIEHARRVLTLLVGLDKTQ